MASKLEAPKRSSGTAQPSRSDWVSELLSIESSVEQGDVTRLASMPALDYPAQRRH